MPPGTLATGCREGVIKEREMNMTENQLKYAKIIDENIENLRVLKEKVETLYLKLLDGNRGKL